MTQRGNEELEKFLTNAAIAGLRICDKQFHLRQMAQQAVANTASNALGQASAVCALVAAKAGLATSATTAAASVAAVGSSLVAAGVGVATFALPIVLPIAGLVALWKVLDD